MYKIEKTKDATIYNFYLKVTPLENDKFVKIFNLIKKYYSKHWAPLGPKEIAYIKTMINNIPNESILNDNIYIIHHLLMKQILLKNAYCLNLLGNLTFDEAVKRFNYSPYAIARKMNVNVEVDDIESKYKLFAEKAKRMEQLLIDKFSMCLLRTEDDLRNAGFKLTPDIVFDDIVKINGKVVKWLEVKDYFGMVESYLFKHNKKQISKYVDAFGPGCIVYIFGYTAKCMAEFNNLGCIVLDGRQFNIMPEIII